ncbi:hypothetical protein PILCRDRAFT_12493 [Piloderma croceum F 1598]|uniref:NACHT domain-containing protein n=1 Tax=Piloderma croceum (strain F 1598) TaxID=765440 RepID=A0A0C3BHE8_PILCF|nr:hypothetical protein PILCRDRAFT_12493 [Piloderma croceum F 1598]
MTSTKATYIDARSSIINTAQGDQHNYYGDSLDRTLRKLEPARMDASNRSTCLEGTRMQLLQSIANWASHPSVDQRILWLHGLVGSGKSTISTTIANFFDERKCLGAFVFFNRDVEERRQPSSVFRTMAHQLGLFDRRIGTTIAEIIETTSNITQMTIPRQFTHLVVNPLLSLPRSENPIVIILDALDECGNASGREGLLATLVTKSIDLPSKIRIIITSRKEPDIMTAFMAKPHILVQELELTSPHNVEDIEAFLRHRMSTIRLRNSFLQSMHNWPEDDKIHALVMRAAGLFVWASTACLFIGEGHDPPKRLDMLLQGDIDVNAQSALNDLYATALESVANGDDEDFRLDFLSIMGMIIVARNPLSDKTIDTLLCLERPSRHTIAKLGCVLCWADGEPIRVVHPSFTDYLSNRLQCGSDAFYIDTQLHNRRLAVYCLCFLDGVLRRNLCGLTLSQAHIATDIPEAISYASMSWIAHITQVTEEAESLADSLLQFLLRHLLHWLEVMSILNMSRDVIASLRNLLTWVETHIKDCSTLYDLIYDGYRFAHLFTPLMEQHPLLIYESALPFTPTNTTLYTTFHQISGIPRITGRLETFWSPRLMVLSEGNEAALSVTITPNGAYIISGLADGTIGIWDSESGAEVSPRLRGHSMSVRSVACSSDGTCIASGSDDSTIRLWDRASGTEVSVLRGHDSRVTCVCFSPACHSDGMSLLSGSQDRTLRFWNTLSGMHVVLRCKDRINAVAFSPDGQQFVSGAADGTVLVRNAASGSEILSFLRSQSSIQSVAFSLDGQLIASGSTDKTIRIWNAKLGTQAFQPVTAPSESAPIRSVAFLNGTQIISGARNGTIRVWNFELGTEDRTPLREHIRSVEALVVSHDGRRIISGSRDSSIRIWDAGYLTRAPETQSSPSIAVTALALTRDGARFATGLKDDHSIHLWDAVAGVEALHPLEGHKDIIRSLSFSPDGTKIASGGDKKDGTIRIWDLTLGNHQVRPLMRGRKIGGTVSLVFSGDGRRIASGSTDGTIRVWDIHSNTETSLRGHARKVTCIAFSPDGTTIVSGSSDCTVRVWDAKSGAQIAPSFNEHGSSSVLSVAFSPDALQIVSESSLYTAVHNWSSAATSGALFSKTDRVTHRTGNVLDSFTLTKDGWIIRTSSGKQVSKLPPNISLLSVTVSGASDTSFVIVTNRGKVIVMHFQEDSPLETNTL